MISNIFYQPEDSGEKTTTGKILETMKACLLKDTLTNNCNSSGDAVIKTLDIDQLSIIDHLAELDALLFCHLPTAISRWLPHRVRPSREQPTAPTLVTFCFHKSLLPR